MTEMTRHQSLSYWYLDIMMYDDDVIRRDDREYRINCMVAQWLGEQSAEPWRRRKSWAEAFWQPKKKFFLHVHHNKWSRAISMTKQKTIPTRGIEPRPPRTWLFFRTVWEREILATRPYRIDVRISAWSKYTLLVVFCSGHHQTLGRSLHAMSKQKLILGHDLSDMSIEHERLGSFSTQIQWWKLGSKNRCEHN